MLSIHSTVSKRSRIAPAFRDGCISAPVLGV
jgi:hypothetical protein